MPTIPDTGTSTAPGSCTITHTLPDGGKTMASGDDTYSVTGPDGERVADGLANVFDALRAAQAHAAGEPLPAPTPAHTLSLPARCTVGELRALLRRVPASATLADVRILGAEVVASLTDLSELELKFTGGAR